MTKKKFPVEDIKNKIQDVLSESEIRFCGLVDSSGELIVGGYGDETIPLENDERRKQMFQELVHRVANRKGFDANLGRVKYSCLNSSSVIISSLSKTFLVLLHFSINDMLKFSPFETSIGLRTIDS